MLRGDRLATACPRDGRKQPEPGYVPRALDPRVGFIQQRHLNHTAPFSAPIERHLASRRRLAKKDPAAVLPETVQPTPASRAARAASSSGSAP